MHALVLVRDPVVLASGRNSRGEHGVLPNRFGVLTGCKAGFSWPVANALSGI